MEWEFAFLPELDENVSSVQKVAHVASFPVLTLTLRPGIFRPYSATRLPKESFLLLGQHLLNALVNLAFAVLAQFPKKIGSWIEEIDCHRKQEA